MQLPLAVNIFHKVARPRNCKTWRHSNWETWLYSEQDCFLVIWNSLQRSLNMAKKLWRIWSTSSWPAGKPLRQLWHARPRRGGSKIKTWTGKNESEDFILPVNSQPFHIHLSLLIRIIVSCHYFMYLYLRLSLFPRKIHLKSSDCVSWASAGPPNAETPRCNAASAARALKVACTSLGKAFHVQAWQCLRWKISFHLARMPAKYLGANCRWGKETNHVMHRKRCTVSALLSNLQLEYLREPARHGCKAQFTSSYSWLSKISAALTLKSSPLSGFESFRHGRFNALSVLFWTSVKETWLNQWRDDNEHQLTIQDHGYSEAVTPWNFMRPELVQH